MAKKKASKADCYFLTMGPYVYLGKGVSSRTRKNATLAGLIPIDVKKFRKLLNANMAVQRLINQGYWYDTVKYTTSFHVPWRK